MIHKQNEEKGILSDKKKEKSHYLLQTSLFLLPPHHYIYTKNGVHLKKLLTSEVLPSTYFVIYQHIIGKIKLLKLFPISFYERGIQYLKGGVNILIAFENTIRLSADILIASADTIRIFFARCFIRKSHIKQTIRKAFSATLRTVISLYRVGTLCSVPLV